MNLSLMMVLAFGASEPERLFDEGRVALRARDYAKACPAFQKSHELEPALGVLLNLATCLEKQGRTASAWVRFNEALAWAQRTHEAPREALARQHATDLKARVSWLSLSSTAEREVTIDGTMTVHLTTGSPTAVPVDVGTHTLVATNWEQTVVIAADGASVAVVVPALPAPVVVATPEFTAPSQEPPPPPPPLVVVTPAPKPSSPVGMGVLTGGLVVLAGGGAALTWSSITYANAQAQRLPNAPSTIAVPRSTFDTLTWMMPASWVALGIGAVTTAVGVVLLVLPGKNVTVTPVAGPGVSGVALSGSF